MANSKLESYISGPKGAGIKEFLWDISSKYSCELEILDHDKGWLTEKIRFRFQGEQVNLLGIQKEIKISLERYQETSFFSQNYKADKANIFQYKGSNKLKIDVSVSRFSSMANLPESIGTHLELNVDVQERKKGFLKGKSVTATVLGTPKQLEVFKTLMLKHLEVDSKSVQVIDSVPISHPKMVF